MTTAEAPRQLTGLFPSSKPEPCRADGSDQLPESMAAFKAGPTTTASRCLSRSRPGFNLPCLNHACDSNVQVMSDLFAGGKGNGGHGRF